MTLRVLTALLCAICVLSPTVATAQERAETINVDTKADGKPFPHFWEEMFGSGRAILSLRESYRRDLRDVKQATGFKYIRFHALLDDEVGIYGEDSTGNPVYNFSYVDQIYDGLLENGVRPFVELSFMPQKLASQTTYQSFFYKPIVAPPKDWDRWGDLISHLAQHLIDRYGIDEVSQWYFEVWNEPNLDFWAGEPKEQSYERLYDVAARAIKKVNPQLRVGGPATAQAAWVDRFIKHSVDAGSAAGFCFDARLRDDSSQDVFGTNENIPRTQMVCRAVGKVHDQIRTSARPDLPLIWSEYNATYMERSDNHGCFIYGSVDCGNYTAVRWTHLDDVVLAFSDVFEEQGVVKQPFYGGYGLIAEDALPKPAFNAFAILHKLGDERLAVASPSALVTRRPDGTLVIAVWNLFLPNEAGTGKQVTLSLVGLSVRGKHRAIISRVDAAHGDLLGAYQKMGSPIDPTREQIAELQMAAKLPAPETRVISHGAIALDLPPQGLAVIEVR